MAERESCRRVTLKINIFGIVQGVGMRPFIARTALNCGLVGSVVNCGGYVEIIISGPRQSTALFVDLIKKEHPKKARIMRFVCEETDYKEFDSFKISESISKTENVLPIVLPDLPVCDECLSELYEKGDRRYLHPFISCTNCGVRYSVIESIPYDRKNITMSGYAMCVDCEKEYRDSADRRFHSETTCCNECGPRLIFKYDNITIFNNEASLKKTTEFLKNGAVVMIKGTGGYHLSCDPTNKSACEKLRELKKREKKPFAVMFKDIEEICKHTALSEVERSLLESDARPIVLLDKKTDSFCREVFCDSRYLGAFLPYTPVQHLLLDDMKALVMTSANLSEQPIIFDDETAVHFAAENGIPVLYHERKIVTGLDDSVARIINNKVQYLRRGRGVTPLPIECGTTVPCVALGGDLKASFALSKDGFTFMSQYLGDIGDEKSNENYKSNYSHMKRLLKTEPEVCVCDLHPAYFSSSFADELNLPKYEVQHHVAHCCSVMAEHDLEEAIGVSFDGTGYGSDGNIWGGEFFAVKYGTVKRAAHLEYIKLQGSDDAAKSCKKSMWGYMHACSLTNGSNDFYIYEKACEIGINTVKSSSAGRLFDAVSCLLGLCAYNSYEGEAAILLENAAWEAVWKGITPYNLSFDFTEENGLRILKTSILFERIYNALKAGESVLSLALGFHYAIAESIANVCNIVSKETGIKNITLSGGVSQNKMLTELAIKMLTDYNLNVYINELVPPNDSGIALGQLYAFQKFYSAERK